jgi:hypothetical protein
MDNPLVTGTAEEFIKGDFSYEVSTGSPDLLFLLPIYELSKIE